MVLYKAKSQEFVRLHPITYQILDRFDTETFIEKVIKSFFPKTVIKLNPRAKQMDQQLRVHITNMCHVINN